MRIVFAGTPPLAASVLSDLLDSSHDIVAVYTQPDRPAGRGRKLQASAVKAVALAAGIEVVQVTSLRDTQALEQLAAFHADVMIVFAYSLLLPKAVLTIPRFGCINIHPSLLPLWRGAAPIQRALWHGDKQTGVTIMQMNEQLDAGDILAQSYCDILPSDTQASLSERLVGQAFPLLLKVCEELEQGREQARQQDEHLATYAAKIEKADLKIDWQQPAQVIDCQIRALLPAPVAYTLWQEQRLKIWQAKVVAGDKSLVPGTIIDITKEALLVACGENYLAINLLQLPGKKPLTIQQLQNGRMLSLAVGERLGDDCE